MIRATSTRRKYRLYSPTLLSNACLDVIEKKLSVCGVAKKYGVPEQTLRDRIKGKVEPETVKSGPPPLFTLEEEEMLLKHIKEMGSVGYGYTRAEVISLGTDYAIQLEKRDNDHPLTEQWLYNLLFRWPDLKVSRPRTLSELRAKATSEENINNYFKELGRILDKYNLKDKPSCIYNVDEKGISQNYTPPHIVSNSESGSTVLASEKSSTVTILGCGNALGHQIPPFFVFPGVRKRQELMEGATPGADFEMSKTGWSNSLVLQNYLQNHFLKYAVRGENNQYILLLYDGHRSHISPHLIEWGKQNNVILYVLPPHTSHILQPMDVGCFGPFAKIYANECHKHLRTHVGTVNRYSICSLACRSYTLALSPQNLQSAFRKSGIYPYNPSVIDKLAFAPGNLLRSQDEEMQSVEPDNVNADNMNERPPEGESETTYTDSSNFFKNRLQKCTKEPPKKARRSINAIVAGKALTQDDVACKVNEYVTKTRPQESTAANRKSTPKKKSQKKKVCKKPKGKKKMEKESSISNDSQPGPSGVHKQKQIIIDDEALPEDSEVEDDEKCCVCERFEPKELQNCTSLIFVKWGSCEMPGCDHWTHLKFCCDVNVLRLHDKFICPCHGLPCKAARE